MGTGTTLRGIGSIVVVLLAAVAVFVVAGSAQAAAVALVGGIAAVLLALSGSEETSLPPAEPHASTRAELDELLDAIAEPVLLIRDGRVDLANRAARALLGSHVVGEDARVAIRHPAAADRLIGADPTSPESPIALVGVGGLDQHWEMRLGVASDGTRIVHLVDSTERHAAERMRVDFVANASHELRTPLASILGFIETLSDSAGADSAGDDPAIRTRFLKIMMDEAQRMQRLVEDLISLSRIEADKYRAPGTPVDLSALVAAVCIELRDAGGARGQDLACEAVPDLPPVAGDAAQLSQLLHNLGGNALKYGRAGTPVTLRLDREGSGLVRLTVTDRGDGIPAEHIPRLTERFYRVDAGRSRALGGTGLGLAIVKHIVERHRGRLDIASRSGEGTTVTVTLPLSPPAHPSSPSPPVSQFRNGDAAGL
ncbi:sensor histidine kinase [Sphingomonas sp.]|jgi:two-component system phosphate regulon sensor histidine kinase PhoR|uniref:sensor histidine kinase n=1 Tax=Sphingomonas sp. TaxID=28214 RepID=UPI002ED921AA